MVVMGDELKNLPPKERLEAIKRLQEQKTEELKKFQNEKEHELKKAQEEFEDALDELSETDEKNAERLEEKKPLASIDEAVAGDVPTQGVQGPHYEVPLEELVPKDLYGLSDYNLYGELARIEQKGYMTPEEQSRVAQIRNQASAITEAYSSSDIRQHDETSGNYMSRTTSLLKRLDDKHHNTQNNIYDTSTRNDVFDGSGYKRE